MPFRLLHTLSIVVLVINVPTAAGGVEHVTFADKGEIHQVAGRILIEDSFGNMILESDDGAYWPILADEVRQRTSDEKPFAMLDKEQLGKRLLTEMGRGFQIHQSKHYVVCYNTTRTYARWCSSLLERLQRAFVAYWSDRGCDIHEPTAPLAVLVFGDKQSYKRFARPEIGQAAETAIGYYSLKSNRIVMYDLTGMQARQRRTDRRGSLHDITRTLMHPDALPLVGTIVHEATHQISFNCGMQKRFADNPTWMSEGLAMYCESPDLSSNRSWRGIGNVNYSRFNRLVSNVRTGHVGSLESLITDDDRMRNPLTAVDAYADAWAWTYFLARWHPDEYVAYVGMLANKPLGFHFTPEQRLADFKKHFGDDLAALEDEFYRRMSRVK